MFTVKCLSSRSRQAAIATGLAVALLTIVACGSGADTADTTVSPEGTFQKVTPSDRVFTFDDLVAAGFKKGKEYNVEELPGALGAWYGFRRPAGGDPIDYEVRIYASHQDAVEYGTALADEATGDDAILNSNDATWKEDVSDLRTVHGGGDVGWGAFGGASPRYADFCIFGNVVLLCEGPYSDVALTRCGFLIDALRATDSR